MSATTEPTRDGTARSRRRTAGLALGCVALAAVAPLAPARASSGGGGGLPVPESVSSKSSVLVVETNPATTTAEDLVTALGGVVKKQRPAQGGFEARLEPGTLLALKASPAVAAVTRLEQDAVTGVAACDPSQSACYDLLPETQIWQQAIGLDQVPGKGRGLGVTVAVLDTGVTPSPDLGARLLARVDLTAEHDGLDHFGHGTHMIGLIAGDGTASLEQYTGAATNADVVSVKVAGWDGATDVSTVIAGLHWAVAHKDEYGIKVLNLSFGTDAFAAADADPLDAALEQAWRAGIVVVVSAGNAGTPVAPATTTLTKPGDDPYVITVGAADTAGTASTADDVVAPFSSRSTAGGAKPDLLAPGVAVVSLRAPGSTIDTFRAPARIGADYFRGSGTSQASAIVAGVVARMLSANPALTPDQVKGILLATTDRTLAGRPGAGAGLLDAMSAVALADSGGALPVANAGLVPSAGTGPLDGARGTHLVYADTDGDGTPALLAGDVDALGTRWTSDQLTTPWTPATWAASPWAAATAVVPGSGPAPAWTGARVSRLSWEPAYFGAADPVAAGWDGRYWGGRYWGGRYWGTGMWQ